MSTSPQEHPYPAHEERDVVLRSGATARLRPIRPADAPALLRFYKGLSPNSLYFRFFSVPTIDAAKTDPSLLPEHDAPEHNEDGQQRDRVGRRKPGPKGKQRHDAAPTTS